MQPTYGDRSPTRCAEDLLSREWNLGREWTPIPVDPFLIARQIGLDVYVRPLEEGVGGLLVKQAPNNPTIYLNAGDSRNRQRFTCAHEIGHFVGRKQSSEDIREYTYVDRRDSLAGRGTDPKEVWANQFAAEMLMPTPQINDLRRYMDVDALARHFRVSRDAMGFRLKNLSATS